MKNAPSPILTTEEGIVIVDSDLAKLKAPFLIFSRVGGSLTLVKEEQELKVRLSIIVIDVEVRSTVTREEHWKKALTSIDDKEEGS